MKNFKITPPLVNLGFSALLVALMFVSNLSIAQNPTVISDSLVVMNRIYAKEKLIVDQEAKFKQDIKVLGTARIDSDLIVTGTSKLNGNVKMENIEQLTSVDNSTAQILVRQPNGQLKTVGIIDLINAVYSKDCGDPVPVPNPVWSNGLNKIYAAYCGNLVNVGIGTTDPQFILDVKGLAYLDRLKVGTTAAIENAMINGFDLTNSRDLIQLGVHNSSTGDISDIRFLVRHDGSIKGKCLGNNTALEIRNGSGHALIAYSNSGTKILQLEDNGMLHAREVKVDEASWPDYVFDKNYKLPKLSAVAKFIKKNNHLPGVPSAEEIKTDGLNLGDMQTIQMQKIEELTLYLIEMDEKMSAMEKRMNDLEKENAELKKSSK